MDSEPSCSHWVPRNPIAPLMEEEFISQHPANVDHLESDASESSDPLPENIAESTNVDHLESHAAASSDPLPENIAESTSVEKRRGRPSRGAYLKTYPKRHSKRTKKRPKILSYDNFQNSARQQWSEGDKTLFLAGCMEVGIEDIQGLKKFLPHKTEVDIKNQIEIWKERAIRRVETQLSMDENQLNVSAESLKNIDDWIDYFKEDASSSDSSDFVMSHFFSIVAEYADLPSPDECEGIDFRAMYRYLHSMINGLPPYGLNGPTSRVLFDCINIALEKIADPTLIDTLAEHIDFPLTKPAGWSEKFKKNYSRKSTEPSSEPIDQILNNPSMNPLGLPKNAVVKETVEVIGSSDEDEVIESSDEDEVILSSDEEEDNEITPQN